MDEHITAEALHDMTGEGTAPVIIDVRSTQEYQEGHLPGALHIRLDELAGHVDDLPTDRPVVTSCSMGHHEVSRSERAAVLLRQLGVDAHALEGGIPAWEGEGYAVEQE